MKKMFLPILTSLLLIFLAACSVDDNFALLPENDSASETSNTASQTNVITVTDAGSAENTTAPSDLPTAPSAPSTTQPQGNQNIPAVDLPADDHTYDEFFIMQDGVGYLGTFQDPNRDTTAYLVEITDITISSVTFRVSYLGVNGSPYYETNLITAKVTLLEDPGYAGITETFSWEDSWGNKGIGTLQLGGLNYIEGVHILLSMTVTQEAEFNRASLATNGNLHLEQ